MSVRSFLVFCIAMLLLQACATKTTKPVSQAPVKNATQETQTEQNSAYFLALAKQTTEPLQRNELLLKTAQAFQTEQQCEQSIRLLEVVKSEFQDNRQLTYSRLLLAECYLVLSDQGLARAEQLFNQINFAYGYEHRIAALAAQIYRLKKQWLNAAKALQNTNMPDNDKSLVIWQYIKQLSLAQLEKASLNEPRLQPWLQLAIITKRFALQDTQFSTELNNWQSRHTQHPLVQQLPPDVLALQQQQPLTAQRIAILLPLTGRLANQGLAVKEGILAAYLDDLAANQQNPNTQSRTIQFFDTGLKSAAELNELVADFEIVIGPLVKDKITELSQLLPSDKLLLALNRVNLDKTLLSTATPAPMEFAPEHYYFALAPEDEAEQLAEYIQHQAFVRPVIFAANNETTQRMAHAFIQKWQQSANASQPDLSVFTDNKDMRERVSELLDVNQSKARIEQIERLADVEVFGVERNRLDIDAIVLFANSEQTELLNPIIEASLSPFARQAFSVFASSRSYSLDLSNNSIRDLRNLTFTDMPWMLPNHNWQALAAEINYLWPQKQDALLRLFAMGFDAYKLLPNLRKLKTLSHVASQGLTGEIYVNTDGVIRRRLPLAKVMQDRVQVLELD